MALIKDFNLDLNADDILRGQGLDPDTVRRDKPALQKAALSALHAGLNKLDPLALIHQVHIVEHRRERILLEGGKELVGPLVSHFLAGAEDVALSVCTIGSGLETLASSVLPDDPLLGLALDGLGNVAVEAVAQQACGIIDQRSRIAGLSISTPLSPGDPEWPVEIGQPQIFSLLNPSRAGIVLTSSSMMIPMKSISFVVGIGQYMILTDKCDLCSLRERCRFRHA